MKFLIILLFPLNLLAQNCEYLTPHFILGGAHQIQGGCTPGTIDEKDMGTIQCFKIEGHRLIKPEWVTPNGRWIYLWTVSTNGNSHQLVGGTSTCEDSVVFSPALPPGTIVTCRIIWIDEVAKIKVFSYDTAKIIVGQSRSPVKPSRTEPGNAKITFNN